MYRRTFTHKVLLLLLYLFPLKVIPQLGDVKIVLPKEIGYSYYDFVEFFQNEKYFALCGQALSIYNTETGEIIDEFELGYGARNLSVHPSGKKILISLNNEILLFDFSKQKLVLEKRTSTVELLKNIPMAEYYSSLHVSACRFITGGNQIYVAIGAFSLIFNYENNQVLSNHSFDISNYITHGVYFRKKESAVLSVSNGSITTIMTQPINKLSNTENILTLKGSIYKIKLKDSLLFCFANDKYFTIDIENKKIIHEVRMPKIKKNNLVDIDKNYLAQLNKRTSITKPDTINFLPDEYVYDMDYISGTNKLVFATSKEIKTLNLSLRKVSSREKLYANNIQVSEKGKRMVANVYTQHKALRIYEPEKLKLIAERQLLCNSIYSSDISNNNRWMITKGGSSAFLWDMRSFSKYAEIRDISNSDSSFINSIFFINDTTLAVNSGTSINKLNLSLYSIPAKKHIKTIKKEAFAFISGFLNKEFYYCDYKSIHIINLQTFSEEVYDGNFALAASSMYKIINFTNNLIFITEGGKYRVLNRKNRRVLYEGESWGVTNSMFSPDEKFMYTTAMVKINKTIGGSSIEVPTNAVVKIDLQNGKIVQQYAETNFPYDFRLLNNNEILGIWYVKYDMENYDALKNEVMYREYQTETGKIVYEKSITTTSVIISGHYTSADGRYFALDNFTGGYLRVYNKEGKEIANLDKLNYTMPKLYFDTPKKRLIITSPVNSMASFVSLENGELIGQLANAPDDQYFLVTKDLHYMGSKDFIKHIRFKYHEEVFSFEQYDIYLNQPHRVLKAFLCEDSSLIKGYENAYAKRLKLMGFKGDTKISFSANPTFQYINMKEENGEKVRFSISVNKGNNKLSRLKVFNNGSLVHDQNIPLENSNKFEAELIFETSSGINRFEFIAADELGVESQRISRFYNNISSPKPKLFLAVLASEKFKNSKYDLSYAQKDANDMAETLINSGSFEKVNIKKMFNLSFSPDSIKELKKYFSQAGTNDVAMIFFAGHGYLDEDLNYYFPTYYTDFSDPKTLAVPYKNFEILFREMKPIRKLMFIDACFSGEVDEELFMEEGSEKEKNERSVRGSLFSKASALEMSKAVFSDLRQNSGATVISSAGGTEAAYESEKWKNGLFTYCLLQGIKSMKADYNLDGKIMLSELQKYVAEEVYRISNGKQSPTYRTENTILDYELWKN